MASLSEWRARAWEQLGRHMAGISSCAMGIAALAWSLAQILSRQGGASLHFPDQLTIAAWSDAVLGGLRQLGPVPIVLFLLSFSAAVLSRFRGEGARWLSLLGVLCGACSLVLPVVLAVLAMLIIVGIIIAVLSGG